MILGCWVRFILICYKAADPIWSHLPSNATRPQWHGGASTLPANLQHPMTLSLQRQWHQQTNKQTKNGFLISRNKNYIHMKKHILPRTNSSCPKIWELTFAWQYPNLATHAGGTPQDQSSQYECQWDNWKWIYNFYIHICMDCKLGTLFYLNNKKKKM